MWARRYGMPNCERELRIYAQVLAKGTSNKSGHVFFSNLGMSHRPHRKGLECVWFRQSKEEYYESMRTHRFVLSPDGDRPDCHRNYEAIGLGAMPITSLNATKYAFFGSSVVFERDLVSYPEFRWGVTGAVHRLFGTNGAGLVYRPPNPSQVRVCYWVRWLITRASRDGRPLRFSPLISHRCAKHPRSMHANTTAGDGHGLLVPDEVDESL